MLLIIPDTNFFLHCKILKELPWEEILENGSIVIGLTTTVLSELDGHKNSQNNRIAKRARELSSLFGKILEKDDLSEVIRDLDPQVTIKLLKPIALADNVPEGLDIQKPDDKIVAEAFTLKALDSTAEVRLITNDNGMRIKAMHAGVKCEKAKDSWRLPYSEDSKDRRIKELEKELAQRKINDPIIEMTCNHNGENVEDKIEIEICRYPQLNDDEQSELMALIKEKYPIAEDIGERDLHRNHRKMTIFTYLARYVPPSEEQIQTYRSDYDSWLSQVEDVLAVLPKHFSDTENKLSLKVRIANNGNVPAENLIVRFCIQRSGLLLAPRDDEYKKIEELCKPSIPNPPRPPEGRWEKPSLVSDMTRNLAFQGNKIGVRSPIADFVNSSPHMPFVPNLPFREPQRDRNAFYWKDRPDKDVDTWEFTCTEFQHKGDQEEFNISIVLPDDIDSDTAIFQTRVSAKNLPDPFTRAIYIKYRYKTGNTFERLKELILD